MSDLTECNYCTLKVIRSKAVKNKQKVTKERAKSGGINILVNGKFVAWFMKLTDHCVC